MKLISGEVSKSVLNLQNLGSFSAFGEREYRLDHELIERGKKNGIT